MEVLLQLLDGLVAPLHLHARDDVRVRLVLLPTHHLWIARQLLVRGDLHVRLADSTAVDRNGVLVKSVEHVVGDGDHRSLYRVLVQYLAAELQHDLIARLAVYH